MPQNKTQQGLGALGQAQLRLRAEQERGEGRAEPRAPAGTLEPSSPVWCQGPRRGWNWTLQTAQTTLGHISVVILPKMHKPKSNKEEAQRSTVRVVIQDQVAGPSNTKGKKGKTDREEAHPRGQRVLLAGQLLPKTHDGQLAQRGSESSSAPM